MKTSTFQSICLAATVIILIGGLSGCKKGGSGTDVIDPGFNSSSNSGSNEEIIIGDRLPEFDEQRLFHPDSGLEIIYFDYNSYALRPDALDALKRNAELIKKVPNAIIQIEGHCDERGTQEYNLALGEKRALATRQHLMNLGVSGNRMITISYGEEDPADPSNNESAWAKNRRSEFNKAM